MRCGTLAEDVIDGEGLAGEESPVTFLIDIPAGLVIRADSEQLYRVLSNLVRNARQAIEATGQPGTVELSAGEDEQDWWIRVGDTGPGLPPRAKEHLFEAFQGGARKGGTGLGLAIAAELVRGPWRAAGTGAQRCRGDRVPDPPAQGGLSSGEAE